MISPLMRTITANQITSAYWNIPKNDPKRNDWNKTLQNTITNLTQIGIFPQEDQQTWEQHITNGTPHLMVEHYHNQDPDKILPIHPQTQHK